MPVLGQMCHLSSGLQSLAVSNAHPGPQSNKYDISYTGEPQKMDGLLLTMINYWMIWLSPILRTAISIDGVGNWC